MRDAGADRDIERSRGAAASGDIIDPAVRAGPASLAGLVNYQNGSVVSRQVIAKKTGTATVFAFDAGQGLSEHTAPFDALITLLEGKADITVSKGTRQVKTGEIILLPAGRPHAVHSAEKFKMLLIMIRS